VSNEPAEEKRAGINWRRVLPRIGAILFAVAVTVGIYMFSDRLGELRGYGLLGLFVISLLGNATLILPAPSLAAVLALGATLPPLEVGLVAGAGMALGELTGYLAGYGGSAVIENRQRYEQIKGYMHKYGLLTIFVLSVIPNPLMDLAGIAAGALKTPVGHFLLACFAGKTLKCIAFAYLGAGALSILPPFLSHVL
jgi:membrane protein YqaA with SNARE-associated domain